MGGNWCRSSLNGMTGHGPAGAQRGPSGPQETKVGQRSCDRRMCSHGVEALRACKGGLFWCTVPYRRSRVSRPSVLPNKASVQGCAGRCRASSCWHVRRWLQPTSRTMGAQSCACFRRGWRRSPAALWYMNYLRALPFSQLWASLQFRLSDVAAGRRHCSISIRVGHTPVFVTRSWNCISAGQVAHFFRWHELLTISEGLSVHLTRV